jgi:hypothetical protein
LIGIAVRRTVVTVVRQAVVVAAELALIRHAVVVTVLTGAICNIAIVRHTVFVTVGLAVVPNIVRIAVRGSVDDVAWTARGSHFRPGRRLWTFINAIVHSVVVVIQLAAGTARTVCNLSGRRVRTEVVAVVYPIFVRVSVGTGTSLRVNRLSGRCIRTLIYTIRNHVSI